MNALHAFLKTLIHAPTSYRSELQPLRRGSGAMRNTVHLLQISRATRANVPLNHAPPLADEDPH